MANIQVDRADRFSYNIEAKAYAGAYGRVFESMDVVRAYVQQVVRSAWWIARCAQPAVSVHSTRGTKYAYAKGGYAAIMMPEWGWNEQTVLHELCHVFTDSRHGRSRHNEKFMYWMFRLNAQFNSAWTAEVAEKVDGVYLEAGINVGMTSPDFENENRRQTRPTLPEVGPVWRKASVVSWKTHIPVPDVHRKVVRAGYTVSSMVRAMGGDKGLNEPLAEWWRPVYAGRSRWLPIECLEHFDDLTKSKKVVNG